MPLQSYHATTVIHPEKQFGARTKCLTWNKAQSEQYIRNLHETAHGNEFNQRSKDGCRGEKAGQSRNDISVGFTQD